MSLYSLWEEAYLGGKSAWDLFGDFRQWAIENKYKAEYGYKGAFNPEGCLKAVPVVGIDMSSQHDKTAYKVDFNSLMRMKLDELQKLASKLGIEITDTSTKKEISTLIVERGQG